MSSPSEITLAKALIVLASGGFNGASGEADLEDTLDDLTGLPYIEVQRGAIARSVATVTVFVDDVDSLFLAEESTSSKFTSLSNPLT